MKKICLCEGETCLAFGPDDDGLVDVWVLRIPQQGIEDRVLVGGVGAEHQEVRGVVVGAVDPDEAGITYKGGVQSGLNIFIGEAGREFQDFAFFDLIVIQGRVLVG